MESMRYARGVAIAAQPSLPAPIQTKPDRRPIQQRGEKYVDIAKPVSLARRADAAPDGRAGARVPEWIRGRAHTSQGHSDGVGPLGNRGSDGKRRRAQRNHT